jgi:hypothetical protein
VTTRKEFLSARHRNELHQESAISPEVTEARGYETIDGPTAGDSRTRERMERLGFPQWAIDTNGKSPALLIPQYAPSGERNAHPGLLPTQDGRGPDESRDHPLSQALVSPRNLELPPTAPPSQAATRSRRLTAIGASTLWPNR